MLTQFQVKQWSAESLCSNPQALIHVINQMGVVQRRTGNKPIVAHGRLVLIIVMDMIIFSSFIPRSHFQYSIDIPENMMQ